MAYPAQAQPFALVRELLRRRKYAVANNDGAAQRLGDRIERRLIDKPRDGSPAFHPLLLKKCRVDSTAVPGFFNRRARRYCRPVGAHLFRTQSAQVLLPTIERGGPTGELSR